ncbi:MAG: four helix bundle protein [Bacteroidetes bacterium RIFCSPLOWO2_12_FULL_35_15]|nr:MAG: four helix bundle protein [Bacteroidetes bacterium RIFCSPLOWO2_12_FULL_35_15]
MGKFVLENLDVYNLSNEIADEIWNIVITWNFLAQDTIGKQIIRSSDSIAANIAEGYGRFFYKENRQFCFYSRGSILETKTWITKAKNRNLITEVQYNQLFTKLETIHFKLNAYMKFIGKKTPSEPVN